MRKITLFLIAFISIVCVRAQKPEITSVSIAGRATGFNEFNTAQMFTKVAEGKFVWYGHLQHKLTTSGSQGFKFKANSTSQGNDWNNAGFWSLRAEADNTEVSDGGIYNALYLTGSASDFKWRLKEGEDGYYKIIFSTSDVDNITMKVEAANGSFADLISLSVYGYELTPAFDPAETTYSCTLLKGTQSIKPIASCFLSNSISGDNVVDVSSGSGTSTIVVTSLDGQSSKNYTINYTVLEEGDEEYTHFVVNNDFDYVAPGVAFSDTDNYPTFSDGTSSNLSAWRPVKQNVTTIDDHLEFYGWQLSDWEFLFKDGDGAFINTDQTTPNQSMGINAGVSSTIGSAAWINGHFKCVMPENFEFYQTIDKDNLSAGTYKLTCLMGVQATTSQRLFANNSVQFYGKESDYEQNKTDGEIYSYAGHVASGSGDTHYKMKVYATISDDESLKIGIRSGNMNGSGVTGGAESGNLRGWFKMDNFQLIKIDDADAADATLTDITLSVGTLDFVPGTTTYNVKLPYETTAVTPAVTASIEDVTITGVEEVDVTSGSGVSTITVTALNGTAQEIYTINYTVADIGLKTDELSAETTYFVKDRVLTVQGADAYAVYNMEGLMVADVKANAAGTIITLEQGIYIVKTNNAKTFKVIVK